MPGNKLGKKDIFDDSFFKALTDADKELKKVLTTFRAAGKEAREMNKAIKGAKTFQTLTDSAKKAEAATRRFATSEKKLIRGVQDVRFAATEQGKQLAILNEKKRRATKANREYARSQLEGVKSTNRWGKALGSFAFKFNALGNIMSNVVSFVSRTFRKVFRGAIDTIVDFNSAMADTKAITGATGKEFKKLSDSAKELGRSTKFTAVEVAKLQKEFSKLGFTTKEILNVSEATLDLAAATGTDLARAAEVAGITLRQFGIETKETKRVVDVMTKSFTSSALDMEKFAEAMKLAGPAARASNISLERTTAMLGLLADAGISGTMAGTALRTLMLRLGAGAGTLTEKIKKLQEKGLDLAGATEEVQRRAATALIVLANGVDTIDGFTDALENAGGTAEEMADIQLDTLRGAVTILNSAWDGLIQAIATSETDFFVFKAVIRAMADDLNMMAKAIEASEEESTFLQKTWRAIEDQIVKAIPLIGKQRYALDQLRTSYIELTKESEPLETNLREIRSLLFTTEGEFDFKKSWLWSVLTMPLDDLPIEHLPEVLKAVSANIHEAMKDIDLTGFDLFELDEKAIDEMTKRLIDRNEQAAKDEINLRIKTNEELLAENERAYREGEISWTTYQRNLTAIQAEEEAERRRISDKALETLGQLTSASEFITSAYYNLKLTQMDAELEAVRGNASKTKQVQIQQAKERQDLMLKTTYINIAAGIARAFIDHGWPAGLIPAAAVGIEGGLQIAAINAQHFEKGVKSSPSGPAWVGEKGSELMISGNKIGLSPDTSTLMNLKRGTEIVPADITNELLKYSYIASAMQDAGDNEILLMMSELRGIKQAIKSKPVASSALTPAGILTATHRGNTTIKRLDKFFK